MMEPYQIVGIVLVKDEDVYIERALRNVTDFCDQIIVTENYSRDHTYETIRVLAEKNSKLSVHRIRKVKESHAVIEKFAGTPTWIFGVDGDEIYDPTGLATLRQKLRNGAFAEQWCIFGNVLHCIGLDTSRKIAKGYLAPPARTVTKLYNFSLIESWVNCYERLHSGVLTFKNGYHAKLQHCLGDELCWEESYLRCLHTVFLKRSSLEKNVFIRTRFDPAELLQIKRAKSKGIWSKLTSEIRWKAKLLLHRDWKHQKYQQGALVEKDVSAFFAE